MPLAALFAMALAGCGGGSSGGFGPIAPPPAASSPPASPPAEVPITAKKAMLIGISGVQYSSLQAMVQQGKAPNFAGFALMPAYTGGIAGSPVQQSTLSEPGWASVLTGA